MNNKPKLVYGIKGKLVSAACMLLVAVIMVVSSTYAWFTLSTAPEVTGIQTAVGANGSLEMALLPESGDLDDIFTSTGTPGEGVDINTSWGNLVDLSGQKLKDYGLNKITLYPSTLNVGEDGKIPASGMLNTPTYGADGRVQSLTNNTVTGAYVGTSFASNDLYGVRAIGVASGMTERQLAYRNALATANTAMGMAKTVASGSLAANGSTLANIALKKATNDAATYTHTDVAALQVIVDDLLGTDGEGGKTGALEYIEKAYKYYILAIYASANSTVDESVILEAVKNIDSLSLADLEAFIPATTQTFNTDLLKNGISAYKETLADVQSADADLKTLAGYTTITWLGSGDVVGLTTPLNKLANVDSMKINGYEASTVKQNMSAIVNSVAAGGITVTMATGGGVYADIADQCGDYTTSITIEKVEYNGLVLENMNARMETASTVDPEYLTSASTLATLAGAPTAGDGATDMPMTEFYGYIIDMAFRTNAADSNLLLQTAPVDRIYSDNGNDETMGHGSSMTFTTADVVNFPTSKMIDLMSALRVVFFDAVNAVVAEARLDTANAVVTGTTTVTANLYLYKTADQSLIKTQSEAVLMPLTQNQAQRLSALVYLDGTQVENGDVAAQSAQSMSGTLNLQFSSSANLIPMEYADLHTSVEKGTQTLYVGEANKNVSTDGATNYTSNNTAVCTVDSDGNLTALTTGEVKITARDDNGKAIKVWTVTVTAAPNP